MQRTQKNAHADEINAKKRRVYVKPECASEPIYETLALACAKLAGQGATCNASPFRS